MGHLTWTSLMGRDSITAVAWESSVDHDCELCGEKEESKSESFVRSMTDTDIMTIPP